MKRITTLLALCGILLYPTGAQAQWTDVLNNNINFELRDSDNSYSGGDDGIFDGTAEPVIRSKVYIDGAWLTEHCHTWSCSPPCYDGANGAWYSGTNYGFNIYWQTYMLAYESDNSDQCTWYTNDDDAWQGDGTLRDGVVSQRLIYQSTDFYPCNWNNTLGNGGSGWLYPNSPTFNQILDMTWRYVHGTSYGDALDFGTIPAGETRSDFNSNRAVAGQNSSVALQYASSVGQPSADVSYKFTLSAPATVTISTSHNETDFDTYIGLADINGSTIEMDDDDGAIFRTSEITRSLCAGTYFVWAEGFQNNTGVFHLTVSTSAAGAPSITGLSSTGVSCPGASDGQANWDVSGGVAPVSFTWNGTAINQSATSLTEGSYTLIATDACGTTGTQTVSIGSEDTTPPIALCLSTLSVDVISGTPTILHGIGVNGIDNGSSDNCGIATMEVSPTTLTTADLGFNELTLTVTDASGNSSTCICTAFALDATGINDQQALGPVRISPVPNNGRFLLDLSDTDLSMNAKLTISDMLGRIVHIDRVTSSMITIDLANPAAGLYLLDLEDNGVRSSLRFIVE